MSRHRNAHTWNVAISLGGREGIVELGYVIHLLEDLGSPAHTRNDPHWKSTPEEDPFESVNEDRLPTIDNNFQSFINAQMVID
jgi:hypothetical protein